MELRDLEYFAAIARHGSMGKASDVLDLSPAALSKSLRRLETAIDTKLMERAPKGVTLTTAGRLLLSRIELLRLTVDDVKREAREMGAGRAGELRVGVNEIDCERLAIACAKLHAEAPALKTELLVSTNDAMVPRLREGSLDLIASLQPVVPFEGTDREILFTDDMVVCAAPRHPLAKRRRLAVADLVGQRWAFNGPDVISRQVVETAFRRAGLPRPQVAIESLSLRVRVAAVATSETLAFHSRRLLRQLSSGPYRCVELDVKELVHPVKVGVMYRKDGYLPRSARRLIELVRLVDWVT